LVAEGFEECTAACSRSTQDQNDLARSHAAINVADEFSDGRFRQRCLGAFAEQRFEHARETEEHVADRRRQTCTETDTANRQITEDDTAVSGFLSLALCLTSLSEDATHQPLDFLLFLLIFRFKGTRGARSTAREGAEEGIFVADTFFLF
jgi:hypothetical protein